MPTRYSLAEVETAKQNLEALPDPDTDTQLVGLQDAIRTLAPTIRKLLARGYPKDKVLELLKEQGIAVSPSTFKQYLGDKATKRTGRRRAESRVPWSDADFFRDSPPADEPTSGKDHRGAPPAVSTPDAATNGTPLPSPSDGAAVAGGRGKGTRV